MIQVVNLTPLSRNLMLVKFLCNNLKLSPKVSKGTINGCHQRNNSVTLQNRPQKYFRGRLSGVAKIFLATLINRCLRDF